jgi:hypothetical protein
MKNHKQFGDLRVGTIVDCLALPGEEVNVTWAGTRHLESQQVDIVISNQLCELWSNAFGRLGYLSGPSNYIFFPAPRVTEMLQPFEESIRRAHVTRGDGDGPINL